MRLSLRNGLTIASGPQVGELHHQLSAARLRPRKDLLLSRQLVDQFGRPSRVFLRRFPHEQKLQHRTDSPP